MDTMNYARAAQPETRPLFLSQTLLVSTDSAMILEVARIHDTWENFRLEVSGRLDKACAVIGRGNRPTFDRRGIALLLVHVTPQTDRAEFRRLLTLRSANRPAITACLCHDERVTPDVRGYAKDAEVDLLCLPRDAEKLTKLMEGAQQTAVPRPPAPVPRRHRDADASETGPALSFFETRDQLNQFQRVAAQDTTLMLTGESGTGKTVLARAIHESSPRKDGPYQVVDCGVLAANLIESEMFGHVKGAFTGAERERIGKFSAAAGGTLVLDEINSLPLPLQCKLLRAVEDRVFEPVGSNKCEPLRARLIVISNVPLEQEVAQGRFRPDLYFRLNIVQFYMPPLRDRQGEICVLAHELLNELTRASGAWSFAPEVIRALEAWPWPGNIRELRNVIERAVTLGAGPVIRLGDLPPSFRTGCPVTVARCAPHSPRHSVVLAEDASETDDELERITAALRKHRNNRLRAAIELGISRVSLYKKLNKYGIEKKIHVE